MMIQNLRRSLKTYICLLLRLIKVPHLNNYRNNKVYTGKKELKRVGVRK